MKKVYLIDVLNVGPSASPALSVEVHVVIIAALNAVVKNVLQNVAVLAKNSCLNALSVNLAMFAAKLAVTTAESAATVKKTLSASRKTQENKGRDDQC